MSQAQSGLVEKLTQPTPHEVVCLAAGRGLKDGKSDYPRRGKTEYRAEDRRHSERLGVSGVRDPVVWLRLGVCGPGREVAGEMRWGWWDSDARAATECNLGGHGGEVGARDWYYHICLGDNHADTWGENRTCREGAVGGGSREEAIVMVQVKANEGLD